MLRERARMLLGSTGVKPTPREPTEIGETMNKPVKHPSILLLLILGAALCTGPGARAAVQQQPLAEIGDAVRDFALTQHGHDEGVKVTASKLDPRLKLARCAEALEVFWAPGSRPVGNATVGVRCSAPKPWKLYVPVRISKQALVAVTARTLTRGHRIGPGDLRMESRDIAGLRADAISDAAMVNGYVVRRATGVDRVLSARMLSAPLLVERGQRVQLLTSIPGLSIRMTGISLEDGARGDSVRVRNPASNRVVRARVVAAGIVQMVSASVARN